MTKLLRFTPAAQADLVGIWDYTAQHSDPDQADRYIDELHRLCLALAADKAVSRPVRLRPVTRKSQCLPMSCMEHVLSASSQNSWMDQNCDNNQSQTLANRFMA